MTIPSSSSQQTAQKLKSLLKELPDTNDLRADLSRLDELRRVFARLVANGELQFSSSSGDDDTSSSSSTSKDAQQKWNSFLQKCHRKMVNQLCARMQHSSSTSQPAIIRCFLGVLASTGRKSRDGKHMHLNTELLYVFLSSLLLLGVTSNHDSSSDTTKPTTQQFLLDNKQIRTMMQHEFVEPHLDVQYYCFTCVTRLAKELYNDNEKKSDDEKKNAADRLFRFLCLIPPPPSSSSVDSNSKYLFAPVESDEDKDEEEHDDEIVEEVESDDQSSDDEDSTDDDDDDEESESPQATNNKSHKKKRRFAFTQVKAHKKALSEAWLAVLKLPLSKSSLKQALQILPERVLPNVSNPLRFADFFMNAYGAQNESTVVSVLALDGLFLLMTQHNLEYPNFYTSLYTLVGACADTTSSSSKYRTRYLQLLVKCLMRNDMLPSYLVAAFCKRLLRGALSAPPDICLFCLALCSNLLRKHPECACLIHRECKNMEAEDPFDATTNDPTRARALESSLWELSALARHYYPAVATMAREVGMEQGPLYNMDDFVCYTYKSLFEQERRSLKRRKVELTFVEPVFDGADDVLTGMLAMSSPTSDA